MPTLHREKNLLAFSFTLIIQNGGGIHHITFTPRLPAAYGGQPFIFQSGKDAYSAHAGFWGDLPQHKFMAGIQVHGQVGNLRNFRNYIYNRFTISPPHHTAAACFIHARCNAMAGEQPAPDNALWGDANPIQGEIHAWYREYGHSEQFLLKYLQDKRANLKDQIFRKIPGINDALNAIPHGTTIRGLILNIHTRLDMCERCAPSLYLEMINTNPESFAQYFKSQLQGLNAAGAPPVQFRTIVSSSMPLQNGIRRRNAGIDDNQRTPLF
jgi:hypothetical protein